MCFTIAQEVQPKDYTQILMDKKQHKLQVLNLLTVMVLHLVQTGASNGNNIPFVAWQWHANAGTTRPIQMEI